MQSKTNTIFYHEDFYRQIELIPEVNYFSTYREFDNTLTDDNSEYGFIKLKIREEHTIPTTQLQIGMSAIRQMLQPYTLQYFNDVTTGYSHSVTHKKNAIAFGFERLALFFEVDKFDIVKNIWMCQSTLLPQEANCKNLICALNVLGKAYSLLLVDWSEEVVVRLTSIMNIQKYLHETFSFNCSLEQ